jgi:hypothetical protein
MTSIRKASNAAALAAVVCVGSIGPTGAAPLFVDKPASAKSTVIHVRDGVRWRRGWHNGYRGYPNYRAGYHNYNGWWYPAGAFVAGALIGGAIAGSSYYYGNGYYGGYYGGYYPRYYPRYYEPEPVYAAPDSSYRAGYRAGYRDGYYARPYGNDITCTQRLESAGRC